MSSFVHEFTTTIDESTYEITIPEPAYPIPEDILEYVEEFPMFYEEGTTDSISHPQFFDEDIMDAYHRYVISKCWTESECNEVLDLIEKHNGVKSDCEEYLDGYVDWSDVWTEKVRDELPDYAKLDDDDEVILGLVRIIKESEEKREEKRKEAQRQENKAILERNIAKRKEALAKLQLDIEQMEALKNQYK